MKLFQIRAAAEEPATKRVGALSDRPTHTPATMLGV